MLPHLEAKGLDRLRLSFSKCSNYLEYGSGGSTLMACEHALDSIISVDSDKFWIDKVESKINKSDKFISINYCDIGPVKDWGIPADHSGFKNYWRYAVTPWKIAIDNHVQPDLVFIDGRFRVACFIYSWITASEGTIILFDDYSVRPEYHVIERFCIPVSTHGRLAEFLVTAKFDHKIAVDYLLEYSCHYE